MTESPRCAAQCRAVMPSPCATLALAPLARSARTAARSPCMAASATGAAAGSADTDHCLPWCASGASGGAMPGPSNTSGSSAALTPCLMCFVPPRLRR
jgi:hypothetical protein